MWEKLSNEVNSVPSRSAEFNGFVETLTTQIKNGAMIAHPGGSQTSVNIEQSKTKTFDHAAYFICPYDQFMLTRKQTPEALGFEVASEDVGRAWSAASA